MLCLFAAVTILDDALHVPLYGSFFCPDTAVAMDALRLHRGGPAEITCPSGVFDGDETCPICSFSGEAKLLAAAAALAVASATDFDRPQYAPPLSMPREAIAHGPRAPPALRSMLPFA